MKCYPTDMNSKLKYDMIKAPDIGKMSELVGQTIGLTSYVLHEEMDQEGEVMQILNIRDEDGKVYATNSQIFIREFLQVCEIVNDDMSQFNHIQIIGGKTKSGRQYLTMKWVD